MRQLVDDVLSQRRERNNRRRQLWAVGTAVFGHTALSAAIALAPALAARAKPPPEFMKVMIVPAKALGEATAPVQRARPKKSKPKPSAASKKTPSKPAPVQESRAREPEPLPSPGGDTANEEQGAGATPSRRGGIDGTTFGTSAFGSSEASFDDPNFLYGYYVQQMLALIGGHWNRPRASQGTEMIIHYRIARNGELSEIEVVQESGNRTFDLAGYRAVTLASPLPPLPQSYPGNSLGVNLVIR